MKLLRGIFGVRKVTPKMAIKFTKLTVYLTCIWPPEKNSEKNMFINLFNIFVWFSILIAIGLLFPLIVSINKFSDKIFIVMKSAILISGIINFIVKLFVVRMHREVFQKIDLELDKFLNDANDNEMMILQKYVDNCWKFQGYMTTSYYLITIGVISGPLFLRQKFPCEAVYPFPVSSPLISTLVYIHQGIVGFQCSAAMALDCQAALFLWYISARFELLAEQSQSVHNIHALCSYIKKHQNILGTANEIIHPIRLIFLTTIFMTKIGIVFGAIMLVSNQPLTVKLQFTMLVMSAAISIFICVWPAEKLINMSGNFLTQNVFYTSTRHPPAMRKLWLNVIKRAQTPIIIKVAGFMDALSYEFYSSFLSTVFSYFTAMRIAVQT